MELTTHFGLHSQATRLRDDGRPRRRAWQVEAWHPLRADPFRGTRANAARDEPPPKRHIALRPEAAGFGAGLLPFRSPLLGES